MTVATTIPYGDQKLGASVYTGPPGLGALLALMELLAEVDQDAANELAEHDGQKTIGTFIDLVVEALNEHAPEFYRFHRSIDNEWGYHFSIVLLEAAVEEGVAIKVPDGDDVLRMAFESPRVEHIVVVNERGNVTVYRAEEVRATADHKAKPIIEVV